MAGSLLVAGTLLAVGAVWAWRLRETHLAPRRDPFLHPRPEVEGKLDVSVIIPARDEESSIGACLTSILKQPARPKEVVVVDDRSKDGTCSVVEAVQAEYGGVKLISTGELPEGWTGKNFACHLGFEASGQRWLLFTDADTIHLPGSLASALSFAEERGLDALSLLPRLEARGFWEQVIQPMVGGICVLWYPARKVNDPASGRVFANGQYFLIRREAYEKIGGHEACRGALLEDIAMARALRRRRLKYFLAYGPEMFRTRMYGSFGELWSGWLRIFAHLFDRRVRPALRGILQVFFGGLWPFIWLLLGGGLVWALAALSCALLWATLWRSYKLQGAASWAALLSPVASLFLLGLFFHVAWVCLRREPITWRGRAYRPGGKT